MFMDVSDVKASDEERNWINRVARHRRSAARGACHCVRQEANLHLERRHLEILFLSCQGVSR